MASDAPLTVELLMSPDHDEWDVFVRGHDDGTFFHLSGWQKVLDQSFGHRGYYLVARREGDIEGVLPLAQVKSLLFGHSLASLPFCVNAGLLCRSQDAADALTGRAMELAADLGVDFLEFRSRVASGRGWPTKDLYVNFRKEISDDDETNLAAIPRKQRAMVRKGIKAGLVSQSSDDVDRLFQVYSESVRNLGTPVFPRRYFRILKEVFGDDCRVLMIQSEGADIAGVMSFYFRDEVLPYYGGSISAGRDVKANDFMYWELMRRSAADGIRVFDYGRSKRDTGSYRFKKHWGFEPQPLAYEYHLVKATDMPNLSPTNPKYASAIALWKRLPLPVTRLVGPLVSPYLG